jgi:hypothetical protein
MAIPEMFSAALPLLVPVDQVASAGVPAPSLPEVQACRCLLSRRPSASECHLLRTLRRIISDGNCAVRRANLRWLKPHIPRATRARVECGCTVRCDRKRSRNACARNLQNSWSDVRQGDGFRSARGSHQLVAEIQTGWGKLHDRALHLLSYGGRIARHIIGIAVVRCLDTVRADRKRSGSERGNGMTV